MERGSWFRKIFSEIVANVVVGLILTGVGILAPQVFSFWKIISSERATLLSFSVLGVALIIYGVAKWYVAELAEQKRAGEMLNPNILVKSDIIECEFTKERGCLRKDTITVRALKSGVKEYKFQVGNTKARGIKIFSNTGDGGSLTKKDFYSLESEYTFGFFEPLRKKEERTITIRWKVDDVKDAPFLRHAHSNPNLECLKFILIFPVDDAPKTIFAYRQKIISSAMMGFQELKLAQHNDPSKVEAIWEAGNGTPNILDTNYANVVEWRWRDRD